MKEKIFMLMHELFEERASQTVEILNSFSKFDKICIHFSNIEKIGIYPKAKWNTPLGICTYPLKETWKEYRGKISNYPFASERKYIMVVKYAPNAKILNMNEISEKNMYDLVKFVSDHNFLEQKEIIHARREASMSIPAYEYWNITRNVAQKLSGEKGGIRMATAWNSFLRKKLGVNIVEDRKGYGIIYKYEPFQVLFLSISSLIHVKTLINPFARK
jgi:hypothetical protein